MGDKARRGARLGRARGGDCLARGGDDALKALRAWLCARKGDQAGQAEALGDARGQRAALAQVAQDLRVGGLDVQAARVREAQAQGLAGQAVGVLACSTYMYLQCL